MTVAAVAVAGTAVVAIARPVIVAGITARTLAVMVAAGVTVECPCSTVLVGVQMCWCLWELEMVVVEVAAAVAVAGCYFAVATSAAVVVATAAFAGRFLPVATMTAFAGTANWFGLSSRAFVGR